MRRCKCHNNDFIYNLRQTKAVPAVFLLLSLFIILPSSLRAAETTHRDISDTLQSVPSRYVYLKKQLTVEFSLQFQQNVQTYFGRLLQIQTNEDEYYNVFLDCQDSTRQLLVYSETNIRKLPVPRHTGNTLNISLSFFRQKKMFTVEVADTIYYLNNLDFEPTSGYKFLFTPNDKVGAETDGTPAFRIADIRFIETSDTKISGTFWYWFIFILVIDLLFFAGFQLRKKLLQRRRALTVITPDEVSPTLSGKPAEAPPAKAVYLFGGFHIYDREGNNITKKFTPLLKELFLLLVTHTPDKGISSEKLREILWFDKTDQSAKNNRAVNFGKLRSLLDTVGEYDLNNDTGNWILKINSEAIYVDYFEYMELYAKGKLTDRGDIQKLLELTRRGSFLNDMGYEWLDRFKTTISDYVTDTLVSYSETIRVEADPDLALQIADSIALFDPLNEYVLQLRVRTYTAIGKYSLAKNCYEKFAKEYIAIYGEKFPRSFTDVR